MKSSKRGRMHAAPADQAHPFVVRQSSYYRPKRQRAEHVTEAATRNLWKAGATANERPGARNPVVAALREPKPVAAKRPQKTYAPKGAARHARQRGGFIIMDETLAYRAANVQAEAAQQGRDAARALKHAGRKS